MKEKLMKLLRAKQEQRDALNAQIIASDSKEERAAIGETLKALMDEIADVEKMLKDVDEPAEEAPAEGSGEAQRSFRPLAAMETRNGEANEVEARARKFAETNRMTMSNKEARASILVSGGSIAQPVGVGGINGLMPQVSSIVDLVKIVDASNMGGGYKIAYQITDAAAADKTEGSAATQSEPTFGVLTVTADDKALVSYISNKVRKQSPLAYEQKVRESAMTALRKAASEMIVDALETSTIAETLDIGVTGTSAKTGVLDAGFLRKITLSYGGDEAVMGGAVLMLNKADLIALGDIRGTNEKLPVFKITPNATDPNTGIIEDGGLAVRYVINNNCNALSGTTQTSAAIKGIFYGAPQAIELAMFSDYEVATSEDYKFAEDMLAVRGTASMGVGMGVYHGFVVAQIPASA
nr:MAG TPA: major capsid protein [Bacteriophage sp.]